MAEIKNTSKVSLTLKTNPAMDEFNKKLKELQEIAKKVSPEGAMYVRLFDRNEIFSQEAKMIKSAMAFESVYSLRALQANPQLATEFQEASAGAKSFVKTVEQRRRAIAANRNKRDEKK